MNPEEYKGQRIFVFDYLQFSDHSDDPGMAATRCYILNLEEKLKQQRFNNAHNLSIDQAVADEIKLLQSWVKHHQKSVELSMEREHKLEDKLAEAEYQLSLQKELSPISVNMVASISELSEKLKIACETLECVSDQDLPPWMAQKCFVALEKIKGEDV